MKYFFAKSVFLFSKIARNVDYFQFSGKLKLSQKSTDFAKNQDLS